MQLETSREVTLEVRGYYIPYRKATQIDPEEGGYWEDVEFCVYGEWIAPEHKSYMHEYCVEILEEERKQAADTEAERKIDEREAQNERG